MYEVEVKVPADLDRVRSRLEALDARSLGAVVQADTYYDAPHRSFPETDEALRIRRESRSIDDDPADGGSAVGLSDESAGSPNTESRITYKGPLVDDESKTREEVETGVADGERMAAILANLGFEAAATVRKDRDRYALEGYTVTLDAVDGVGEYVEVETEVDAGDEAALDAAREEAFAVLRRLDLDPADQIRTSYLELLLEGC